MQTDPRGGRVEPEATEREVKAAEREAGEFYDEITRPRLFPLPKTEPEKS